MNHLYYEGEVFHKRFSPKEHQFTYPFFLLDINMFQLDTLKNGLFSYEGLNLFAFSAKDHFGTSKNFYCNIVELLARFDMQLTQKMRFITLPRVANYVFNPISILMFFHEDNTPKEMLVEVHNYNGGRVVYPVKLHKNSKNHYEGSVRKDMYVSPFLEREGEYFFELSQEGDSFFINIELQEDEKKKLIASFRGVAKEFNAKNTLKLFCKHTFLTFWVVTRTLWQSLKLWLKGIKFMSVTPQDQIRRF